MIILNMRTENLASALFRFSSWSRSLMFWISGGRGDRATIEKSWMDGSDRSSLTVLAAQAAHGLTADVAARRLFWVSDFKKVSQSSSDSLCGRFDTSSGGRSI